MSVLFMLIPVALCVAGGFLAAFLWAVRHGQFDDVDSPQIRMLIESKKTDKPHKQD